MAHAKDDARYWKAKIHFPRYTSNGQTQVSKHYAVRMRWQGKRLNLSLKTGSKEVAAQKARDIYLSLVRRGFEATMQDYRPAHVERETEHPTLGEFLLQIEKTSAIKLKTFQQYRRSLRMIVAHATGVEPEKNKFARSANWINRVDSAKLSDLTTEKIQEWKVAALKRKLSANSVNATLDTAKALFSPDRVKFLRFPVTNPFAGVKMAKKPSARYHSSINLELLTREALAELPPEPLKFFLLAALGGLRRGEIDCLEWGAFNWDKGIISIARTEWFQPKSESSVRSVELDPEVVVLFRGFHAQARDSFVIESGRRRPRKEAPSVWYRCKPTIRALSDWLRTKGAAFEKKPLHTLRKEFGSQICERHGIYAASLALGHANIGITARYYLDKKSRATVGLGHLLAAPQNIVQMAHTNSAVTSSNAPIPHPGAIAGSGESVAST